MGTRGLCGIRFKAKDYLTYNNYDSYPEGLGQEVLRACKEVKNWRAVQLSTTAIILVDDEEKPTPRQMIELQQYANTAVSEQSLQDWYCLLRKAQGRMDYYLKGKLKYMIDSSEFIKDSLFCEWGYIVNLDTMKLEVWKGFQEVPDEMNRYGTEVNETGYYPCKLIKEYPLRDLPTDEEFIQDFKGDEK